MAVYHLSATPVQRSKGETAIAGAAYRSATLLQDRVSGVTQDYRRKSGVVESRIVAPEHAPGWVYDREELWNRAEQAEKRRDGQPAREIRIALPDELDDEQRADLVVGFCKESFVSRGMVADVSIHRPDRNGDARNHHAHILLTMRELDGEQFAARKQRDWNQKDILEAWREEWEINQNRALEAAGSDARVDRRSLEAQGSAHLPTLHMGKDATAKERVGIATRIGDQNREIRAYNEQIDALVSELAAIDADITAEMEKEFVEAGPEPIATLTGEEQGKAELVAPLRAEEADIETAIPVDSDTAAAQSESDDPAKTPVLEPQEEERQAVKDSISRIVSDYKKLLPANSDLDAVLNECREPWQKPQEQERLTPEEERQAAKDSISRIVSDYKKLLPDNSDLDRVLNECREPWQKPQEQKRLTKDSLFKITSEFEKAIREHGKIREVDFGTSRFGRAEQIFKSLYNVVDYIKTSFNQYFGRSQAPAQGREDYRNDPDTER